jgi:hypothetical protein
MAKICNKKTLYLVFGFNAYYPNGGWNDFITSVEKIEDVLDFLAESSRFEYYHIVDGLTYKLVKEIKIK